MRKRALLGLLLSSAALAQTQYGTSAKPGSIAHANAGCPWLTEGSAAHALGGEVSVTAKVSDTNEGFCTFTRQDLAGSLEILVSKAALPACPPESTSLKGIGNEALRCRHAGSGGASVGMISSRVRDYHFTVMFTMRGQTSPTKPDDPQHDALEQIAEQVAGNLY